MHYGEPYWNIKELLPYQRNFNFIDSIRSVGKSYTTQGFFLDRFFERREEFVYIVRTQDEKKDNILADAFEKVLEQEFPDFPITINKDKMLFKNDSGDMIPMGYCFALSEKNKIKKKARPRVKWMMFDEYCLEPDDSSSYYNGWSEPDALLNIYHTVDREQNRVVCFFLGNTINFYNPYHMHPAFKIQPVKKGEMWMSENVLYLYCGIEKTLEEIENNKFLKMIQNTRYGNYAVKGQYMEGNESFLGKRTPKAHCYFNFVWDGKTYGLWVDREVGKVFISYRYDPGRRAISFQKKDHTENTLMLNSKSHPYTKYLTSNFRLGLVKFEDMEMKSRLDDLFRKIL